MKNIILIAVLLPFIGLAQDGKPIKSVAIPRVDLPKPDEKPETSTTAPQYSLSKPFEPKKFKFPSKIYEEPKTASPGMTNQPKSDLNVGKQYAEKMNKSNVITKEGSGDSKEFRRDMYFGEFVTESATISLSYRDFGEVDADRIRIWIDGKLLSEFLELDGLSKKIYFGLIEGVNFIEIEALNEGALFPNTGEFGFYDENNKVITQDLWGLSTGFKAKFNIRRVPKGTLSKNKLEMKEKMKEVETKQQVKNTDTDQKETEKPSN